LSNCQDHSAWSLFPLRRRCIRWQRTPNLLACAVFLSLGLISPKQVSGQSPQAENEQTDIIRGTVVNSVTHEPIGRALVFSTDNQFATMTDGQGRFEFILLPVKTDEGGHPESAKAHSTAVTTQGEFQRANRPQALTARKPGFLTDSSEEGPNSVLVTPGKEITISLVPEALIIGRVVPPSSDAPLGIRVEVYRRDIREGSAHWALAGSFMSNSGEYRFAELVPGTYKILSREVLDRDPETFVPGGQQYGYPPAYYPGAADFEAASPIELFAGKTVQADLNLVRRPYYTVKIPVGNAPVGAPMEVSVFVNGHRGPGFSLGYNPTGQAIEGLLPNGDYTVQATSYGPNSAMGAVNINVRGADLEGSSMVLVRNGSISVNVKEEFTSRDDTKSGVTTFGPGKPHARHQLNMWLEPADSFGGERGGSFRPPVRSDHDSLVIENVQPGRYWVKVNPIRGFASSVSLGRINLLDEPLIVGPGGLSSPIEVILRDDGGEIEGKVEGADATYSGTTAPDSPTRSAPFAYVYCVPLSDSNGQFTHIGVSSDGKFTSPEMPPGAYRVFAFKHPQQDLEYRNAEAMRRFETKGQVVHLVPGQKEHLQLQLISSE
jgi:hypothetical protein